MNAQAGVKIKHAIGSGITEDLKKGEIGFQKKKEKLKGKQKKTLLKVTKWKINGKYTIFIPTGESDEAQAVDFWWALCARNWPIYIYVYTQPSICYKNMYVFVFLIAFVFVFLYICGPLNVSSHVFINNILAKFLVNIICLLLLLCEFLAIYLFCPLRSFRKCQKANIAHTPRMWPSLKSISSCL